MKKRIGLIINPVAGIGGAVGLKGSDGEDIQRLALEKGAEKKSGARAREALLALMPFVEEIAICAAPGEMGAGLARELGFETLVVGQTDPATTAADTRRIARALCNLPVDVLLFAGGDGTARDICAALPQGFPAIGIPAGVKIHSAVYAVSPGAAGRAAAAFLQGNVRLRPADVMDLDEDAYREGRLSARLFGYLTVPDIRRVMQNPKAASHNSDDDLGGLCAEAAEQLAACWPQTCVLFGAGSTVHALMRHMGLSGTLIGVDAAQNGRLVAKDADEKTLLSLAQKHPCRIVITPIGGQGHLFGRGNQQFSPRVIRAVGLDNILVVAAAAKIYSLPDQQLYVDTGDAALDAALRGYRRVVVGWQEALVCNVV